MFMCAVLLSACQNSGQKTVSVAKGNPQSAAHPLPLMRSMDGVQDVHWELTQIQGEKAQFFYSAPYLLFNTQLKQVQGNTGCNALSGSYEMNVPMQTLNIQARAGHMSCEHALAQEAVLMDILGQAVNFQVSGNRLTLRNESGQVLLQGKKR
ncbi:hypothetical protein F941_02872 [Acinetobacter bouvetii DSM 14964 = CIP 107468]|uniref:DUF306 domain-containing protein n=1 Tax=Acinetobacter bouvetii DSM 14964 = CIP 107468 TaxID=1120925 RepID=N9DGG9_9GAMM|nr:META domain-containing protein [Acinetobacter bouvetii]ENV81729.1 hypothetical protein F941_02872 [Acinetobacter bouvetii DSM 14964 = CIP 107468]